MISDSLVAGDYIIYNGNGKYNDMFYQSDFKLLKIGKAYKIIGKHLAGGRWRVIRIIVDNTPQYYSSEFFIDIKELRIKKLKNIISNING